MRVKRLLLWTGIIAAVLVAHAVWHQVDLFGTAEAQSAARLPSTPPGIKVFSDRDAIRFVTRQATVTLTPDGTLRVDAPKEVLVRCVDDVKIEGYDITLDASSDVVVEANGTFSVAASDILLGGSNSDVVLADGSFPLMVQDNWERVVVSDRVKAR